MKKRKKEVVVVIGKHDVSLDDVEDHRWLGTTGPRLRSSAHSPDGNRPGPGLSIANAVPVQAVVSTVYDSRCVAMSSKDYEHYPTQIHRTIVANRPSFSLRTLSLSAPSWPAESLSLCSFACCQRPAEGKSSRDTSASSCVRPSRSPSPRR